MRDYAMIYGALKRDLGPFVRMRGPHGFALRAQLRSFYKKLSPTGNISESAMKLAQEKFLSINHSISDTFQFESESDIDDRFFNNLKRYIRESTDYLWDERSINLDVSEAYRWIGVGPGASSGVNSESFYTKLFDGDLTGTSPYLLALYRAAICETGAWADAEKARSNRFGYTIVEGNKLFFVPKTAEVARTCCTEPLLNMMIQKVIGGFLEHRLERFFGIRLDTQPDYNRELCRIGSLNGSFGTIDLRSASDSISWALIQKLFPANVVGWLSVSRSPFTTLPNGEKVKLKMISTMGNGFTFPLQTLLFAAVVRAVYHEHGLPCSCPRTEFGVFGDDIIVARECYDDVIRYLTKLGFQVNADKSFNTGPFRESCGHDYYEGTFVRPVYIQSLETTSAVYSALNRLIRWSAVHGFDLSCTVTLLRGMVRFRPIPYQESDDAGIKVPFFVAQCLGHKGRVYQKLTKIVRQKDVAESPEDVDRLGYRDFNHDGWLTTYLGGFARTGVRKLHGGSCDPSPSGFFTLRDKPGDSGRYRVASCTVPYWDWHGLHADGVSHSDWEATVTGYML